MLATNASLYIIAAIITAAPARTTRDHLESMLSMPSMSYILELELSFT